MAETISSPPPPHTARDPRALPILAKTIYRELRQSGLAEEDVMSVASELLSLVAADVRARRPVAAAAPRAMPPARTR